MKKSLTDEPQSLNIFRNPSSKLNENDDAPPSTQTNCNRLPSQKYLQTLSDLRITTGRRPGEAGSGLGLGPGTGGTWSMPSSDSQPRGMLRELVIVRVLKRFWGLCGIDFLAVKLDSGDFQGSWKWWELGAVQKVDCIAEEKIKSVKLTKGLEFGGIIFPPKFGVFLRMIRVQGLRGYLIVYLWDTYKKKYGKFVGTSAAKKIILPGLTFIDRFYNKFSDRTLL